VGKIMAYPLQESEVNVKVHDTNVMMLIAE